MTDHFSRRSMLRAAGTLSGIGVLGTGTAAAKRPSRFIVGTSSRGAARRARSRAKSVHRELDFGTIGRAVAGRFSERARKELQKRSDVRYVEPDGEVVALGQTLPWGIDRIDADVVHANGETGAGADVAIIDTGIDSDHPDLQSNLGDGYAVETCSGTDCTYAWDDDNDHGTHCAGIAGAASNSEGVIGVGSEATLHAVKVLDSTGSGTFSGVAEGVKWVADQGYDVGSMSLGASSGSQAIRDACQYAYDRGVLLVAAAGNDGPCTDCVGYPAAYSTVVAVSATEADDDLASWSSTGPEVDIAAPGLSIYSTVVGGYDTLSGTSMACPHVSGAGGMLMANGYSHVEARDRLHSTAEDIGLPGAEQGHGLLDAEAALADSSGDTTVAVSTATPSTIGETSVTLEGDLTDLGDASSANCYFEYRESGASSWTTTGVQTLSATGSFSQDISGLEDGIEYQYRTLADASDGDTDSGSTVSFTTTDDPPAVTTASPTDVTDTSVTLNGSLDDLGHASSAECHFEYREVGTSSWAATSTQTLTASETFNQSVSGLTSSTDYEYRAVIHASDGDSGTGSQVTFTTGISEPRFVVDTNSASTVGETTATLNGSLDNLGGADSAQCYFEWGERGGSLSNTTSAQTLTATGAFDASLSGLSSGTDYEFCAVANASDGDSETGSTSTFTTDSGASVPAIDNYTVIEAGSPNPHAEITADWAVSDADGDLARVRVAIYDQSGSLVDAARTTVGGGRASGSNSWKLKHRNNKTFDVRVTVTDATGTSTSKIRTVSS